MMLPQWLVDRGVAASFLVVALVLLASVVPVARVLNVAAGRVQDVFWEAAIAFVVIGRVGAVLLLNPRLLLDPLVAVRFGDDLALIPGVLGALAWAWWRRRADGGVLAAGVAGIGMVVALAAYDLACPLRGACGGRASSLPIAFPQDGLPTPRLPAAPIEALLLLITLAIFVGATNRWSLVRSISALLLAAIAVHFAVVPWFLAA